MRNEMDKSVRLFGVWDDRYHSVIAVQSTFGRLVIKRVGGKDLKASSLIALIRSYFSDEELRELETMHLSRKHQWVVSTREGMSGCLDFILGIEREEFSDTIFESKSAIHVSMNGKLNRGINVPLMDLLALASAVRNNIPQSKNVYIEGINISPVKFKSAWEGSGFFDGGEAKESPSETETSAEEDVISY